ncbi:hypothetical protein [Bifidobacterium cuniculi]|uniref:hypothetical protein n=1 Tax=Bifidobacterium cuniculi TaxID=1688 RepID=UPI00052995EA|nr:hypothetical protein [Bifidobacterium cuniculi]
MSFPTLAFLQAGDVSVVSLQAVFQSIALPYVVGGHCLEPVVPAFVKHAVHRGAHVGVVEIDHQWLHGFDDVGDSGDVVA